MPVFKKGYRGSKKSYRPVNYLPVISKNSRKVILQLNNTFHGSVSKCQCGFRKGFNAQQCLFVKLENWKKAVDTKNVFGALLTDHSKALNCLSRDLIIAKLNAYRFSFPALNLNQYYLANGKQRTKIDDSYSPCSDTLFVVSQGSILGPLLFNINSFQH